jgi:hypothetical protein
VGYIVEGSQVTFATATRNPSDKFNRKKAHDMVNGRLKTPMRSRCIPAQGDPAISVLEELSNHRLERVRKAAENTMTRFFRNQYERMP